jgi:hypothetical protein
VNKKNSLVKAIPATPLSTLPVLLANIARNKHSSLVVRSVGAKEKALWHCSQTEGAISTDACHVHQSHNPG